MNSLIKINNQELQIKEFNGNRVVTFKDIDRLHERPHGTAKRNFNENKFNSDETERFIQGVDYFHLTFEEARGTNFVQRPNSQGLTVLTESGYLMLVKSLQDDLAWKVQRELVNNYFRGKKLELLQEKIINEMKVEISSFIDEIVSQKIDRIEEKCSKYYRPASIEKYNISQYIKKRLGISRANEEYELVKQRVLIKLGGTKWEDIPIETLTESLNIIDESIRIIKADRKYDQTSIFD